MAFPARELSVGSPVGASPWTVSDELWDRLEPLLPQRERRFGTVAVSPWAAAHTRVPRPCAIRSAPT